MNPITEAALECRNLRKEFPGVVALDDVSFRVASGEIHALVGENGAGKSTLVKMVAGQLRPDEGELLIHGAPVTQFSARAARGQGVTMVPQHPDLFPSLTALENLFVGEWPRGTRATISWREMKSRAEEVLAKMQVEVDLSATVESLTVAERQLLQIARALLTDARLLILDEPTAPLGQDDTERLFALIRRLNEQGVSMIYISHRLAEVFELAHTVTVLRDGRLVDTLPIEQVTRQGLVGMMVGSATQPPASPGKGPAGESAEPGAEARPVALSVHELSARGKFENVSFALRSGEIVGIAGVAGSGRNEVLKAIAGVLRPDAGTVSLNGTDVRAAGPGAARRIGLSFVPADRHHEALVLPMSVKENITLGRLGDFAGALGLVRRRQESLRAEQLAADLRVRAASIDQPAASLSGGNQQKVALASRVLGGPQILLLEEPTQGVDVGARAEIHRLMRQLVDGGVSVLLVSSDLNELLALSDRVLVMHRGRLVGEFNRADATQQAVLDLALGTTEEGVSHEHVPARKTPMRELGLAIILGWMFAAIAYRAPSFLELQNLTDILVNNSPLLIAAIGMTFVILTAGIDVSVGSLLACCATVAAAGVAAGLHPLLVLLVALLAGGALGGINAGLITKARVPPIIATLATMTLFRHVLIHITGGRWINLPPGFREIGMSAPLGIPAPVWIAALTAIAGAAVARWTPFGRSVYAVGSNPVAAEHQGISVAGVRARVYLLMGVLAALAAFVYTSRYSAIQTSTGIGFEMVVITAVVVGGTNIFGGSGSMLGTVIGILLLGVISGSLTHLHIAPTWERAFQGLLILLAVVVDTLHGRRGRET